VVAIKRLSRAEYGDELPPGVNDVVKVSVRSFARSLWATRWPAAMATKGVVSRILPVEVYAMYARRDSC